jgi:hypothetical protein
MVGRGAADRVFSVVNVDFRRPGQRHRSVRRRWVTGEQPRGTRRARRIEFDDLSKRVIGCAIVVHRELGPGLLEFTYRNC